MNSRALLSFFRTAVKAVSLLTPAAIQAACVVDTSAFEEVRCSSSTVPVPAIETVQLAPGVDGLALFTPPATNPISTAGRMCGGARDEQACLQALANLSVTPGLLRGGCNGNCSPGPGLVISQGDLVTNVTTPEVLLVALGTIDTPQEAVLVALANGVSVQCGRSERGAVRAVDGGFEVVGTKGNGCDNNLTQSLLFVASNGTTTERNSAVLRLRQVGCVSGRRPMGLRDRTNTATARRPLASHLARMARLEAASVHSFERLAKELSAHNAPKRLRVAAQQAAREEVQHAKTVSKLARSHGGRVRTVTKTPPSVRALSRIALENVVEGCVVETWGALLAHYQAAHASDKAFARAMRTIAREETSHAALSRAVDEWVSTRLDERSRKRIAEARNAAVDRLRASLRSEVPEALRSPFGFPPASVALALFDRVEPVLRGAAVRCENA